MLEWWRFVNRIRKQRRFSQKRWHKELITQQMEMLIPYCVCNDIFNHTSLCEFYQGRLLLHFIIPFEGEPKTNLPDDCLKYYWQRKSLTTRRLAEQVGVVPATILMYECNEHPIPYEKANKLAAVLDINADKIYDDFEVLLTNHIEKLWKAIVRLL